MYSGTVRVIRGTTLASKLQHVARFCTTPVSTEDRRTDRLHTHGLTTNPLTNPLTRWLAYHLTLPLGRLELLHALVIKHGFSPEHGFGVAAVLPFVLPLCSSASDRLLWPWMPWLLLTLWLYLLWLLLRVHILLMTRPLCSRASNGAIGATPVLSALQK